MKYNTKINSCYLILVKCIDNSLSEGQGKVMLESMRELTHGYIRAIKTSTCSKEPFYIHVYEPLGGNQYVGVWQKYIKPVEKDGSELIVSHVWQFNYIMFTCSSYNYCVVQWKFCIN